MFCRKCGVRIEDDSVFCYKCGERVIIIDAATPSQVERVSAPESTPMTEPVSTSEPTPMTERVSAPESTPMTERVSAPESTSMTERVSTPAPEPTFEPKSVSTSEPELTIKPEFVSTSEPKPIPAPTFESEPVPSMPQNTTAAPVSSIPVYKTEPVVVEEPAHCENTSSPVSDYINVDPSAAQARYAPHVIDKPMKWYKFLVYFALWAGAIVNFSNAVYGLLGIPNGTDEQMFYFYVDGYEDFERAAAIFLLGLVVFQIYTCIQLLGYRKKAPILINAVYFTIFAYELICTIAIGIMVNTSAVKLVGTLIGLLIVYGPFCALNAVYFNKRKHLFIY